MENFASFNSRNIFEHFTASKALFLSIDALDFKDANGEPSPKMKVRCCVYDDDLNAGNRITQEICAYLPLGRFLVLANDALAAMCTQLSIKKTEASPFFEHFGGTKATPVTSTRLALVDGMGNDATFAFAVSSGPGKVTAKGGIIPAKKEECEGRDATVHSIFINMPDDKMKEFCLIGKAYAEQFIALDLQTRLSIVRKQRDNYRQQRYGKEGRSLER